MSTESPTSSPNCDQLHELLPAYVVGGLDTAEKRLVERLLQECPEMAAELRDYAQMAQAMNYAAQPVQPPVHLHTKLMAAIAEPVPQILAVPVTPVPRRQSNRLWPALALAAGLLLIVSNLYWFTQLRTLESTQATIQQLFETQQTALVSLSGGSSQRVQLVSTSPGEDQIYASVVWNPSVDQALLYSDQLAALPPERTYQLWLIGDANPISGGIFQIDNQGQGVLIFQPPQPIGDYAALAISEEPASGSLAPTTDPLAVGEV